MSLFYQDDGISIYCADVLDWAEAYDGAPFHAVFCDPPYGLGAEPDMAEVLTHWLAGDDYEARGGGFMGRGWDNFVPGPATWRAIRSHVHPAGYGLAFGGTRTADLLSVAMRLAGWEKFDELNWVYGSGFPKSHNISKAIDKAAGAERESAGPKIYAGGHIQNHAGGKQGYHEWKAQGVYCDTLPATSAAQAFDGYGTALKPAHEPVLCFRNQRDGRTYADVAQETGAGGLWIDGGRVPTSDIVRSSHNVTIGGNGIYQGGKACATGAMPGQGRFPANLIHDGSPAVLAEFARQSKRAGIHSAGHARSGSSNPRISRAGYVCNAPEKRSTGDMHRFGDSGTAARYFATADWSLDIFEQLHRAAPFYYCSKANRRGDLNECNAGAGENKHPTVKPLALTKYIATLLIPPQEYAPRRLLVPFAGSGSEAIGALLAGWDEIVLVEMQERHCEVARDRLIWWRDAMTRYGTEPKEVIKAARKNGHSKQKELL